MNSWSIIGLVGIGLYVLLWLSAFIHTKFFYKEPKQPTDENEFDPTHPEDFTTVGRFPKPITITIILLSIIVSLLVFIIGFRFAESQNATWKSLGTLQYFLAYAGVLFLTALALVILWTTNIFILTTLKRKPGTSLTVHAKKEEE